MNIVLASSSPRRTELIRKVLREFPDSCLTVIPSDVPETVRAGESPRAYVVRTASEKAAEVYARTVCPQRAVVLGFDTVVTLNGQILGKPETAACAEHMFKVLCGNTHEAVTGVAVIGDGKKLTGFETTRVTFGAFDPEVVFPYIETGAPFDKAGGYGLQDAALGLLITKVEGDPDNVVGLPAALTVRLIKEYF